MQRVKTATAVANKPPYSETGTPGYFTNGDAVAGLPATVPGQDFFNMIQGELLTVITAAGLTPSATDDTQLYQAIAELIAAQAVEVQPASETVAGILKLAALAQAIAGTNTATAMTPADVAAAALSGTGRVAVAAGTADALTATVPSAQTALIHGMSMLVRAAAANATITPTFALTLGATATGAKGIVGPAGTALAAGAISGAGHWLALTYDATLDKWVLGNPAPTAAASIVGEARNLKASATGASASVAITADELVVKDAAGRAKLLSAVNVTASTAATGAGGLDTGAIAISAWYALWIIAKDDGTTAALLSLSDTTPTLPAGYTYKARIGWIRTDATANKHPLGFTQIGHRVAYTVNAAGNVPHLPIVVSGLQGNVDTPTFVAAAVAGFVPPSAKIISLVLGIYAATAICAPNAAYGGLTSTTNPVPMALNLGGANALRTSGDMVLESGSIYYAANSSTCFVACAGWEE